MNATRWMAGILVTGVVAAGVLWLRPGATAGGSAAGRAADALPPPAAPADGAPVTPWCRPEESRRYALSHRSTAWATVLAADGESPRARPELTVETAVQGALVVQCEEGAALGQTRVAFQFDTLDTARVTAGGQSALTDEERAALLDTALLVDMQPDGEIQGIRFTAGSTELGQNIMQLLLGDLQVRAVQRPVYDVTEETIQGTVVSNYRWTEDGQAQRVARVRETFTRLRASEAYGHDLPYVLRATANFTLGSGVVVDLVSDERLVAGGSVKGGPHVEHQASTALRYLGPAGGRPRHARGRATVAAAPGRLAVHQDFGQKMLDARAAGLTGPQLKDTLLRFANGGELPDHSRFLWRATGLLRGHPELVDELAVLFHDGNLNSRGRQMILDLLVGAGTSHAQGALRNLLASATAQQDPTFSLAYQRLGLLAAPDDRTLETARMHYVTPGVEGKGAAVYAYGAVLGNRLAAGDDGARTAAGAVLRDLQRAASPADQVLLLTALGNAGVPEQAADIAQFASSSEPRVREASANALRKFADEETTELLVTMVGDHDVDVQRRALLSLMGRPMDGRLWTELSAVVGRGRLGAGAYDLLLDLVAHSLVLPEARATLEAVLQQRLPSVHVMGRARELLARYQVSEPASDPEAELDGVPVP